MVIETWFFSFLFQKIYILFKFYNFLTTFFLDVLFACIDSVLEICLGNTRNVKPFSKVLELSARNSKTLFQYVVSPKMRFISKNLLHSLFYKMGLLGPEGDVNLGN